MLQMNLPGRSFLRLLPFLLLPGLCSCGDSKNEQGYGWKPSADSVMPLAFPHGEDGEGALPDYVRAWRMPPGFAAAQGAPDFPTRWNRRVRQWVADALAEEDARAARAASSAGDGSTAAEASRKRRERLLSRAAGPDYLRFLPSRELPENLTWESNWGEPDIGDPRARKGGVMRIASARSYPNTFRVMGPNSDNSFKGMLHDDVNMDLVMIHPGTGRFIPGLADRWAIADGGSTVYFHIDAAAAFSDGRPVTTRDFVAALFLRTSEPAASSRYTNLYLATISGITIYGDKTLAVHFPAPNPMPLANACIPCDPAHFYSEFGPDFAEKYQWRIPPVTGGYVADPEGIVFGRHIRMKRVREWWARDRRYTRYSCNVDFIDYAFYSELQKIRELFRIGELDAISVREPEYWYEGLEIAEVHHGYIRRVQFHNIWPRSPYGFYLNCSRPPFNDVNIRLGFQHSLNIDRVIETVFRGDYTRLHTSATGFGEFTNNEIRAREYSPAKAREYFARAGYTAVDRDGRLCTPEGKRLEAEVSCMLDPFYANFMAILKEDAARCGLELHVEQLDNTVFYLKTMDKKVQAAVWNWAFTPPIPIFREYFHSSLAFDEDGRPVLGSNNITATADAQMDRLLDDETFAVTAEAARDASRAIQQRIHDLGVWVPGWTTTFRRIACWRWVQWPDCPGNRFCPPRFHDPLDSHLYWIDGDEKERTFRAKARGEPMPEEELLIPVPDTEGQRGPADRV